MPKALWALAALFLASCASEPLVTKAPEVVSPEADHGAPGMIPPECEALLQKSQEWGYRPGERWQASSDERALEVVEFFSSFFLVPENSARYYRAWLMDEAPKTEEDARRRVDLLLRAQSCDAVLAMVFLDGVLDHRFISASNRSKAGEGLLRFVLNQQARSSHLFARAVSVHVTEKAKQKKLMPGPAAAIRPIRAMIEKHRASFQASAGTEPSSIDLERATRQELAFADSLRDQLSRHLPLP